MAQKSQDHIDWSAFTPRNSPPQSRITPFMTENSLRSCVVLGTGRTCSKELKTPSWYLQIMPTSTTTEIQGKLDHTSLDTSQRESNTTYSWNTNLELQTAQMPYPDAQIMRAITQTMTMYSYGQTSTSANNIQTSESLTSTA